VLKRCVLANLIQGQFESREGQKQLFQFRRRWPLPQTQQTLKDSLQPLLHSPPVIYSHWASFMKQKQNQFLSESFLKPNYLHHNAHDSHRHSLCLCFMNWGSTDQLYVYEFCLVRSVKLKGLSQSVRIFSTAQNWN